jgi:hypothetical protein
MYEYLFLSEESLKYCPNLVNFGPKHKVFKSCTSILDGIEWANKPYHASVPLKVVLTDCAYDIFLTLLLLFSNPESFYFHILLK